MLRPARGTRRVWSLAVVASELIELQDVLLKCIPEMYFEMYHSKKRVYFFGLSTHHFPANAFTSFDEMCVCVY